MFIEARYVDVKVLHSTNAGMLPLSIVTGNKEEEIEQILSINQKSDGRGDRYLKYRIRIGDTIYFLLYKFLTRLWSLKKEPASF